MPSLFIPSYCSSYYIP